MMTLEKRVLTSVLCLIHTYDVRVYPGTDAVHQLCVFGRCSSGRFGDGVTGEVCEGGVADIKRESEAFEIGHSNVGCEAFISVDQRMVMRITDPQIGRCLNEVLSANKRWIFLIARPCHKLMNAVLDVFMRSYAHHRATLVRPRPVERRPKDFRKRTT